MGEMLKVKELFEPITLKTLIKGIKKHEIQKKLYLLALKALLVLEPATVGLGNTC